MIIKAAPMSSKPIEHQDELFKPQPVFVTRDEETALSIWLNDGAAIVLNSGYYPLDDLLTERSNDIAATRFIVCGNDIDVISCLERHGCPVQTLLVPSEYESIADWSKRNPERFERVVAGFVRSENYGKIAAMSIDTVYSDFVRESKRRIEQGVIKTGIESIDDMLEGGLTSELYCLAANSGAGKTTLALQICDHISRSGTPVIIFSLEMTPADVLSRIISRQTYINDPKNAYTSKQVMFKDYGDKDPQVLEKAAKDVLSESQNTYIEGGLLNVNQIAESVAQFIAVTGKTPVVMVDYLQLMPPPNELRNATPKDIIDYSMRGLLALRKKHNCPILLISSSPRSEYGNNEKDKASQAAYKGSGDIEYTVDVGMVLSKDKNDPEKVNLTIVKGRYVAIGSTATMHYIREYNCFK